MSIKNWKRFAHVTGRVNEKERLQFRLQEQIRLLSQEKQEEIQYLDQMIKEVEEQYQIELKRRILLKQQCDQAFLRGVSAISMEALKMSQATLNDVYKEFRISEGDKDAYL